MDRTLLGGGGQEDQGLLNGENSECLEFVGMQYRQGHGNSGLKKVNCETLYLLAVVAPTIGKVSKLRNNESQQ